MMFNNFEARSMLFNECFKKVEMHFILCLSLVSSHPHLNLLSFYTHTHTHKKINKCS